MFLLIIGGGNMSYIYYNPNPLKLSVGDCTIRAISKVTGMDWKRTYLELLVQGYSMYDMPSANRVWVSFLKDLVLHKNYYQILVQIAIPLKTFVMISQQEFLY